MPRAFYKRRHGATELLEDLFAQLSGQLSCSLYRAPIARLAAAQAAVSGDETETLRTA